MSKKYQTTKMFAVQVSTHDYAWGGPKEPTSLLKRALQILIISPAVVLFLIPSFKIGRATYRKPEFALPDSMKQGTVFAVPGDEDVTSVQLEGHAIPEVKSKQPMFLVAAVAGPSLDLSLNYRAPEKKLSLKSLLPHFEHPVYDVFTKQIRVEPAEEQTLAIAGEERAAASVSGIDAKTFTRTDGLVSAACWKEPMLEELPPPPARPGRRPPPRQATLSAAGSGEVVQVSPLEKGERTIVVYHGGGLYSRYYGIRESRVRKGDRVSAGLAIAVGEAGNWKKPATAHWDLFLGATELNRANFLALSSQICDSK